MGRGSLTLPGGPLAVSWVRPLESRPELPPGGASVSFAIFKKTCAYYF